VKRLAAGLALALALAAPAARAATQPYVPNDPLYPRQWYLPQDHAFDFWSQLPVGLPPVRVGVVDSGVDFGHPDLQGRVVAGKSFVGGSWKVDTQGHGTFVAGMIAAATGNQVGIAGLAFPAQLLIAKVVQSDGTIDTSDEAKGIRWAVDNGARVINLSIGGLRDPFRPTRDTYSAVEQGAIDYAIKHGAVVVAAVGNGDDAPTEPWRFASYPAALPHVVGVAALTDKGNVPDFSNRDPLYVDVSAPGAGILSTFPRAMTAKLPSCVDQGYSDCGPPEYRAGEGTSFAAPQVSAAAALLLALRPGLAPNQVSYLLERTADDVNAASGCRKCPLLRDSLSGWGRLDVAKAIGALSGTVPPRDAYEANDDAGTQAFPLYGATRTIRAAIDYWDDDIDVYRVYVRKGQRLYANVSGPARTDLNLLLWKPGTLHVYGLQVDLHFRVARSQKPGPRERLAYRAPATGWYFLEAKIATPGSGAYTLSFAKAPK
jgi:subtilisin family serine protease